METGKKVQGQKSNVEGQGKRLNREEHEWHEGFDRLTQGDFEHGNTEARKEN